MLRQAVVDQHVAERDPLALEHLQHQPVRAVERFARKALSAQPVLVADDHELVAGIAQPQQRRDHRSEEHTSELQSLMRISYAVFCLKKKKPKNRHTKTQAQKNNTTTPSNHE